MNRKSFCRILAASAVALCLASSAVAECSYPNNNNGVARTDIEPGRSSVPTAPMISWEEQRQITANWCNTGSLTPSTSSQSNSSSCDTTATVCPTTPPNTSDCTTGNASCEDEASVPCGTTPVQPTPTPSPTSTPSQPDDGHYTPGSLTSQEWSLYESINYERVQQGLNTLPIDFELSAIAREKSQDMIDNRYFAHESPTLGSASDMLDDAGYQYVSVGENIARSASVEKAHAALMSSDGHRRNILGSQWKRVGIGVVNDKNGYPYITELFVR